MNNNLLNIFRFIIFVAIQVFIFNNINLFGYLNPYPYVLFILLFPVNGSKYGLLISSFLIGLTLDTFLNSGGVHTTASLLLAYVRPYFFKFSFGLSYEYQTIKIADKITSERISFILISVFFHHLVLFILEFYRLSLIINIVSKTFATALFTAIISVLILYLIKPNRR